MTSSHSSSQSTVKVTVCLENVHRTYIAHCDLQNKIGKFLQRFHCRLPRLVMGFLTGRKHGRSMQLWVSSFLWLCFSSGVSSKFLGSINSCSWLTLLVLHTSVYGFMHNRKMESNRLARSGRNFLPLKSASFLSVPLLVLHFAFISWDEVFCNQNTKAKLWKPIVFEIYTLVYLVLWGIGTWAQNV